MPGLLLRREPRVAPPAGAIDVHAHVSEDGQGGASGSPSPQSAAQLLAELDRVGFDRAVAVSPPRPHYAVANEALRRAAVESGGRLVAAARLGGSGARPAPRTPAAARSALRAAVRPRQPDVTGFAGFGAVVVTPHADGLPNDDVLAEVRRHRLPVLVHATGAACPPAWVARVLLPKLSDCPVVLCHLGAFPCSAEHLDDAVGLAAEGRVWLDTAAVWLASFLDAALRRAPERVLFGSEAPQLPLGLAWQQVTAAVPEDALLPGLSRDNAQRMLRW